MDKYEYKLKLDELKELVQLQNYPAAAEIADEVNWQKVRNAKTLCMVADVYEAVERYAACQDVLMQAYDHSSVGRNIVGRLCDIAIKSKDVAAAEEFYNEFLELAPKDTQRYVFAYKIACLKNAPVSDRIAILEEFKEKEYSEMWAYELAVLYAQAGMREKCVEACDELILWFGDGEYVERALDLKRSFQPLTQAQEEKYQKFRTEKGMVEINIPQKTETTPAAAKAGEDTEEIKVTKFNTQNLQEEIAKSMEQIESATEENTVRDQLSSIKKIVQDIPYLEGEEEVSISNQEKIQKEVDKGLRTDFKEKLVEETTYGQQTASLEEEVGVAEDTAGMSIEDILSDWEKTKAVAQEAMASAEQKKLDLEKERALSEASAILKRLDELVPILSATPGEDLPDTNEGTVADELLSSDPIITKEQPAEGEETDAAAEGGTLPADQAVTRPLMSRGGHKERNPQDKLADVESLEDWSEEDDKVIEQVLAEEMQSDGAAGADTAAHAEEEEKDVETIPGQVEMDIDALVGEKEENAEAAAEEAEADTEAPAEKEEEEENAEAAAGEAEADADMTGEDAAEDAEKTEQETTADEATTEKLEEEEGMLKFGTREVDDAGLSDEIKEMFSYFIPIPGMAEQISSVLTNTVKVRTDAVNSAEGNLIVQGEEGSGKTILATDLIKATQKTMGAEDEKIGKISADALNTKNFASLVPKIAGGFLIIEKAGNLNPETVATMSSVMEQDTEGMTVLLEDDSEGIRRVMSIDPGFAAKFTEKVKIPIFTIDELVDFGQASAIEQECEIEEMAVLALYNRINNIQKLEHPTTLTEVKEIVDEAIENAEGGGIKKIFAKKYNDEDYLILHEEDFEQSGG